MKLVGIRSIKTNEVLSTPIRMADGRILLPKGAKLTEKYIEKLKGIGIYSFYVEDEFCTDIDAVNAIEDSTKAEALKILENAFKNASKDKPFNEAEVKALAKKIINDVKSVSGNPINLYNTFMIDDPRYMHSINVCIMSCAMAMNKGYMPDVLEDITIGALLHDIKLDTMEGDKSQEHTLKGFEYLKLHRSLSARSYMVALAHHEKFDGTGFPRKVAKQDIYEGARLVAVADHYDKLISGYINPLPPHEAFEEIYALGYKTLDVEMLELFKNSIALYPTGATIVLNNGQKGIVSKQNKRMPLRPVVRVQGNSGACDIDLLSNHTLFISKICID